MVRFVRPEARLAIWRWREVIAGIILGVVGLWWILDQGRLLGVVGAGVLIVGAALALIGLQRGRFRGGNDGVGTVEVDEGQITYFGPLTGGSLALRDVTELALLRTAITEHWRLTSSDSQLFIPVNAAGADALFDAFAALPGLQMERLLSILRDQNAQDTVIWTRDPIRTRPDALH